MTYQTLKNILEKTKNIENILKKFKINVHNYLARLQQESEIDKYGNVLP